MTMVDYKRFIDPAAVPRLSNAQRRMSFAGYPPFLERLVGMWGPLFQAPFSGITVDGQTAKGLFQRQPDGAPVAASAQAASRWLAALPSEARARVQFPLKSDFWRSWHNTPLILRDPQIELGELDMALREQALEVVRVSLSPEGYRRAREVMANNLLLGQVNDLTDLLNDWAFALSIFGEPSSTEPWGWQFFGHHLALNCLFVDGQMTLSPVFLGMEPDDEHGEARRQIFLPHETQALALFHALGASEQRAATLYESMLTADQPAGRYHPDDGRHVGGAFQDNRIVPYEGLPIGTLGRDRQRDILALAELFIANMPDGPAGARLREIERYLDQSHFAWIGPANDTDPFYFRIHGPVALIEFDHHSGIFLSNQEPEKFHVHTIVRTPNGGDYGADLLRQHYALGGHDAGGVLGKAAGYQHGHDHHHDHGHHAHGHSHADHGHHHDGTPHSHDCDKTTHRHHH